MTKPVTENVLAAGALALVVTITRVGPAPRAPVAAAAHSPAPASDGSALLDADAAGGGRTAGGGGSAARDRSAPSDGGRGRLRRVDGCDARDRLGSQLRSAIAVGDAAVGEARDGRSERSLPPAVSRSAAPG